MHLPTAQLRLVSVLLVLALVATGAIATGGASAQAAGRDIDPLTTPQRLLDSRDDGRPQLPAGSTTRIPIPGAPAAAALNVTATGALAPGYLTVWDCSPARPVVSNLNYTPADIAVPGVAVSGVSPADGAVCVYTQAATHIVVDLFATAPNTSALRPIAPARVLDTRQGSAPLAAGGELRVPMARIAGAGSTVVANLTAVGAVAPGWAALYPCSEGWSGTSTVNWIGAGAARANAAFPVIDEEGFLCVRASTATHIVLDAFAVADPGAQVVGLPPQRVLDTRWATSPTGGSRVGAGGVLHIPNILTGGYGTLVNVTVTGATGAGWARLWSCAQPEPTTSNVNFDSRGSVANAAMAATGGDGPLCLRVAISAAHVVVDASALLSAGGEPAPLRQRAKFGAWVDGMVADPARFSARERLLGTRFDLASYFYGYGDWFPVGIEQGFADGGSRDVLISWDMGPYRFTDWSSGRHDRYLRTIGRLAADYPYPIYVRPWPEMNGDWQPYQPTPAGDRPHGGTPAEFVAAWRHVVDTVRAAGGGNIRWVFNAYAATYPTATDVRSIWPGADYVDVLGMDGYNWGGGPAPWQGFTEVFAGIYSELTALHPTLPVWICEISSREPSVDDGAPALPGRDKGAWVADMFAQRGFSRVTAIAWFDERKERDWRFDSSPGSLAAFRGAR